MYQEFEESLKKLYKQIQDENNPKYSVIQPKEKRNLLRIVEDFMEWTETTETRTDNDVLSKKKQFKDVFSPYTQKNVLISQIQSKIDEVGKLQKEKIKEEKLKEIKKKLLHESTVEELLLLKVDLEENYLQYAETFVWVELIKTNISKINQLAIELDIIKEKHDFIQEQSEKFLNQFPKEKKIAGSEIYKKNLNFLNLMEVLFEKESLILLLNQAEEQLKNKNIPKIEGRKLKRSIEDTFDWIEEEEYSAIEIKQKKYLIHQNFKNHKIMLEEFELKLFGNLKQQRIPKYFSKVIETQQRYNILTKKANLKAKVIQSFYNDDDASQTFKLFPVFSLGNEQNLVESYLNSKPIENLHKDAGVFVSNSNSIEFRVILTEFDFNSQQTGMYHSFKGVIDKVPKYESDDPLGKFKCALMIGPWFLEFTETSICIPKRIHPTINDLFIKIPPIKVLKGESLEDCAKKLSTILVKWNTEYTYKEEFVDKNSKEGNAYHFVMDILTSFFHDFKFNGMLNSIMEEIKKKGISNSSNETLTLNRIQIKSHSMIDIMLNDMTRTNPDFKTQNLHDYLLFQAIDIAYWFRALISEKDEFIQNYNEYKDPNCPCFERELFADILKLSTIEHIEFEYPPSTEKSPKKLISMKKLKSSNSLRNLMHSTKPGQKSPKSPKKVDKNEIASPRIHTLEKSEKKKPKIKTLIDSFRFTKKDPNISPVTIESTMVDLDGDLEASELISKLKTMPKKLPEQPTPTLDSPKISSKYSIEVKKLKDTHKNRPISDSFLYYQSLLKKKISDEEKRNSYDSKLDSFLKHKKEEKKLSVFEKKYQKELFKEYTKNHYSIDEFDFYELYHQMNEEHLQDRKSNLQKTLLDDFIDPNGKRAIYFSEKQRKRLIKLSPEKAIFLAYQQVFETLELVIIQFREANELKLVEGETVKKSKFPKNFNELTQTIEEFKIFSNFVSDNFGDDFIQCWLLLTDYSKKPTKELLNELMNLSTSLIKNSEIREKIKKKDKPQMDWYDVFYAYIHGILSNEFYPRFVHSRIWKNYIETTFKKLNLKFEDLYEISKIEKEISILSENAQYLIVNNFSTNESFKAKRVVSNSDLLKSQAKKLMDQIKHDNILQLIDLFNEDLDHHNQSCLTIITTMVSENLAQNIKNLEVKFKEHTIVEYMVQLLSAIESRHTQSKYFEFGELREDNIYLSTLYNNLYLDPGIYFENQIYPSYFNPPENKISEKSDIYSLGFIFFRLITLMSPQEIENLFHDDFKSHRSKSFIKKKKKKFEYYFNAQNEITKLNSIYHSDILNLIVEMINPQASERPSIKDILQKLESLQTDSNGSLKKRTSRFDSMDEQQISVLKNDKKRRFLKEFMRKELSIETILFFEDVQIFNDLNTEQERFFRAEEIFLSYFSNSSFLELNVSEKLKKLLNKNWRECKQTGKMDIYLFDEIGKHLSNIILNDTFRRFKDSEMFEEMFI
eukprot:gene3208-5524_t